MEIMLVDVDRRIDSDKVNLTRTIANVGIGRVKSNKGHIHIDNETKIADARQAPFD